MIFDTLREDIDAFKARDPAARSEMEIMLCYPGYHALVVHRLSHRLWKMKLRTLARFLSYLGRIVPAIEIHPAAVIGRRFVIDHGTGVVIGATSHIGDDVKIYQGVTLGALSVRNDHKDVVEVLKRHPTLEDRVTVYAGATILGGDTVIGADSVIGGNVWLVKSVPPNSKIYHRPKGP